MKNDPSSISKRGIVSLEACIFLTIFIFIVLLLTGFFQMFMAQNITAHVLLQTSNSLALDSYATSQLKEPGGLGELISGFLVRFYGNEQQKPTFVTDEAWYKGKGDRGFDSIIRTRFIGYLADGDDTEAHKYLNAVRVVGGLNGLDFSESKIENGNLYVTLKYDLEFAFRIGSLTVANVRQTAASRMWADDADSLDLVWNNHGGASIVITDHMDLPGYAKDIIYGPQRDGSSGLWAAAADNPDIMDMILALEKFCKSPYPFTEVYLLNASDSVWGFGHNGLLLKKEDGTSLYMSFGPFENGVDAVYGTPATAFFAVLDEKATKELLGGDREAPVAVGISGKDQSGTVGKEKHTYNNSLQISVTNNEGMKIASAMAATIAAPGVYNVMPTGGVYQNQCATVANDVLNSAGKGIQPSETNFTGIPNFLFDATAAKHKNP